MARYPKLFVDFSKVFHFSMAADFPFEKIELEPGHLHQILNQKCPNLKERAYFPAYSEEKVLVALLRFTRREQDIMLELLFYFWNFIDFFEIYKDFKMTYNSVQLQKELEIKLDNYISTLPIYYWGSLQKLL